MFARSTDPGVALVTRAIEFAVTAHGDQVRKYTGEPYVLHPIAVARILEDVGGFRPEVIAAAYLHDVLEDTKVTADELRAEFGDDVTRLVLEVTDVSPVLEPKSNRARRKALDREHLARASAEGQSIKVADLIDNTKSIVARDPKFARVYLEEKAQLLTVLTNAHARLLARAWEQVT